MSVATASVVEKIFKVLAKDKLTTYLAKQSDVLAWLPLKEDFGGWRWWKTFRTNALAGSTSFGTAFANRNTPNFSRAEISRSTDHVIMSVSCEAIRASRRDEYAVVSEVNDAMAAANETMALSLDSLLWGDGGGSRGRIGSISTDTITLKDTSKIYLFQPGDKIQLSANDGTGTGHTLRDNGATLGISSISQSAGTITCDANITTISGAAANDYIFREGDFDQGAQRVLQGFFAWILSAAPTSATFFNIDRTQNPGALAGMFIDGGGANPIDTIKEAASLVKRNRGRVDSLWVNPAEFTEIDQYLTSKELFTEKSAYPDIGFSGFKVPTCAGVVKVMANSAVPGGQGLLTLRESWLLRSLDGLPHPVDDDGKIWHLEQNDDALQGRLRYFAQLGCLDPKHSCNVTF